MKVQVKGSGVRKARSPQLPEVKESGCGGGDDAFGICGVWDEKS